MKKLVLSVLTTLICVSAFSEIKIISTEEWWKSDFGNNWTNNEGLVHGSSVYGETFWNSGWQYYGKGQVSIEFKDVIKYFQFGPGDKRTWEFMMPLTNLNAERHYNYWSEADKRKKQNASDIYWGFTIGFVVDGRSTPVTILLKRSNEKYYYDGTEQYGSAMYITYKVNVSGAHGSWQESYWDYPSCEPGNSPVLKISCSYRTSISWAGHELTAFNSWASKIDYIEIHAASMAKVLIGKPIAHVSSGSCWNAKDLIQSEQYALAIQKLYRADETYCEDAAVDLCLCYYAEGEMDKCIKMCDALIKYNGAFLSQAYYLRGLVKEEKEQYLSALDDYQKAGSLAKEAYENLYNALFSNNEGEQEVKQTQTTSNTQNSHSKKPQLTR